MKNLPVNLPLYFTLSFQPFVDYLKKQQEGNEEKVALTTAYNFLISQLTPYLALGNQIEEPANADHLKQVFELITFTVFPLTQHQRNIPYAFGLPNPMKILHYSAVFGQQLKEFPNLMVEVQEQISPTDQLRLNYQLILEKAYGVQTQTAGNNMSYFSFKKEMGGLTRYYRINIDLTFLVPRWQGDLPPLQPAWINFSKGFQPAIDEVANPLPFDQFSVEGFAFFWLEDVTEAETIQKLREVFTHLQSDTESIIYSRFERGLRNYLFQSDLQIGVLPLVQVNDHTVYSQEFMARSLFLKHSGGHLGINQTSILESLCSRFKLDFTPIVIPLVDESPESSLQVHYPKGVKSFILYPIMAGDTMLGALEIGSPHAYALDEQSVWKLEAIVPLVRELLLYQRSQFKTRLDRTIKHQFTTLQPAVEWKFNEVAWDYLQGSGKRLLPIRFPDVYPIYGAIDIRNSSTERNKAVRQDFGHQLAAIEGILSVPDLPDELALPEQLLTKRANWANQLTTGLSTDDETELTLFLTEEIKPYFQHLLTHHAELETALQRYFKKTDPKTGLFNQALRLYERSQDWLNLTIKEYIEQEEKQLQVVYPHYFEKFRTDGLEYTIYVGQSIEPQQPFGLDNLRQFRLWQLSSMVDMANLTRQLLPHLPLPLQTTQLILAHGHAVDIGFRQDERRFDVEGSYSIRYEVIKKRIDKAYVRNTTERLTQPDTIALIYANNRELADYLPLIDTLQKAHKLLPELDYLELEPLQGVSGLKALRLRINYNE